MRKLFHGLIAATLLALPVASQAGVFVSVTIAPPALPVYVQPPMPAPGYMWTPGYWAWDGSYYWVPGTWVMAPVGLLWTPGYWGWANGVYAWNAGYWARTWGFTAASTTALATAASVSPAASVAAASCSTTAR